MKEFDKRNRYHYYYYHHHHHHYCHHISGIELGHLLTRSGLTYPVPVQRLNVPILLLDVPCCGPVTHSGEVLVTGKSHGKKPDETYINSKLYMIYIYIYINNIYRSSCTVLLFSSESNETRIFSTEFRIITIYQI